MNIRLPVQFLAISSLALGVVGQPAFSTENGPAADVQALKAISTKFVESWNHHRAEEMSSLFMEDAKFTNFIGIVWNGRNEIIGAHRKIHETLFKDSTLSERDTEIRFIRPDVAVTYFKWHLEGGLERGTLQPSGPREGFLNFVVVKGRDGWKISSAQNTDIKNLKN